MACVEELQQVESFSAPDFTQNYPVGAVPESCFQKVSDCNCGHAILLWPCFESEHIRFLNLYLCRVLDQDDPFLVWYGFGENIGKGRLSTRSCP